MQWPQLAELLLELNIACGFNLLAIFSACFGGHFLSQMGAINPAPCWCMVAPTETVDPAEIMRGLRLFYDEFTRELDIGKAIAVLSGESLTHGRWFGEAAETWYHKLVVGYIKQHCTKAAATDRARGLRKRLKREGKSAHLGALLRKIRFRNRTSLAGRYFESYFIIDRIPGNSQRFNGAKENLLGTFKEMRSAGEYLI